MSNHTDRRVLLLAPQDNSLVACESLAAGTTLTIDNVPVTLSGPIELGHKLARHDIHVGEKVLRYGAVIGTATVDIARGAHIHLHNLKSDYLPTHLRSEDATETRTRTSAQERAQRAHG